MKRLFYLLVLALVATSCTTDSIEETQSQNQQVDNQASSLSQIASRAKQASYDGLYTFDILSEGVDPEYVDFWAWRQSKMDSISGLSIDVLVRSEGTETMRILAIQERQNGEVISRLEYDGTDYVLRMQEPYIHSEMDTEPDPKNCPEGWKDLGKCPNDPETDKPSAECTAKQTSNYISDNSGTNKVVTTLAVPEGSNTRYCGSISTLE